MIAFIFTLPWWCQLSIPLAILFWIIFGANIYQGCRASKYNRKPIILAIIYTVFCGLLASCAVVYGAIGVVYTGYWLQATYGGAVPYVAPVNTNAASPDTVIDTVVIIKKEALSQPDWMGTNENKY